MRALEIAKDNKGHVVTGAGFAGMAGVAFEMFRMYSQASDKAGNVLDVAREKAAEAGALEQALGACMEVVKQCVVN